MSSDEESRTEVAGPIPIRSIDQELQQQPAKKRKANLVYNKRQTYDNLMLAKDDTKTIVLEGSKLVYVDERQTKSCTKINYRCKKGCPVRYHLMLRFKVMNIFLEHLDIQPWH